MNPEVEKENVFDAEATQEFLIDKEANVFAVVKPYKDELYLQSRKNFVEAVNDFVRKGIEREVTEAEIKANLIRDSKIADELIETLKNYPDLPENWKELLPFEDKQSIIRRATNFVIDEDSKKITLGKTIVPTACYFNGEPARQQHVLRLRTIDDSSRYALIESKQFKPEKIDRLGGKTVNLLVLQDEAKWKLYQEMRESVKGFANDKVPMRVGVMVIDHIFADLLPKK